MKNLITIAIIVLSLFPAHVSFAQMNISTSSKEYYDWNVNDQEWIYRSKEESFTFFEFNKNFTYVKHVTSTISSGYLIKESVRDQEDGKNQYIFSIVSDVGNKYTMIIDMANENISFLKSEGVNDSDSYWIKYTIKKVW